MKNPCEGCPDNDWCEKFTEGDKTKRIHIECLPYHRYQAYCKGALDLVDKIRHGYNTQYWRCDKLADKLEQHLSEQGIRGGR